MGIEQRRQSGPRTQTGPSLGPAYAVALVSYSGPRKPRSGGGSRAEECNQTIRALTIQQARDKQENPNDDSAYGVRGRGRRREQH